MSQNFDLVIHGGTLVTSGETLRADLGIKSGKIVTIGYDLKGIELISAEGLYVLPGAVDPHVHLDMFTGVTTSSDDWNTGTLAAAHGGTTTVIDFVEPKKGQSMMDALSERRAQADLKTNIDYALHMTIDNTRPETVSEISKVMAAGVTSFKVYTTYGLRLDDPGLMEAFVAVGAVGGLMIVHAENDTIVRYQQKELLNAGCTGPEAHPLSKPAAIEGEAVERVISFAETAGAPVYIVHVSSGRGADAIARARSRRQPVYGETCPQYLLLTDDLYSLPHFEGAKFVCSPPLRKAEDNTTLWYGLAHDVLQTVGTDHCPFYFKGQKDLGKARFTEIPGGIPGIEGRLALMYTFGVGEGRMSLNRWIEVCCTNPAKIFGLYPRKGTLMPGADADIVLFDPHKKVKVTKSLFHENVDYTPYEGLSICGYPVMTILRGKVLIKDGIVIGKNKGEYLACGLPELPDV